jgi:hypothetical protein
MTGSPITAAAPGQDALIDLASGAFILWRARSRGLAAAGHLRDALKVGAATASRCWR